MSDIVIRPFEPTDKAAAMALFGELHAHERPLQPSVQPWETFEDAFWKWLSSNIEKKSGFILMAEENKKILGLVAGWDGGDDYPGLKSEEQKFGYIGDIVVTNAARKRGVGTMLMKAAEDIFRQRGFTLIRLVAWTNNDLAGDFYTGKGMERYATIYRKYLEAA